MAVRVTGDVFIAAAPIGLRIVSHHTGFLSSFLKTAQITWAEGAAVTALGFVPVSILKGWKIVRRLTTSAARR